MVQRIASKSFYLVAGIGLLFAFQNCGQVSFESSASSESAVIPFSVDEPQVTVAPPATPISPVDVCSGVSCSLTPITNKAAVITILLALGDEANSQLVVNGASAQLIAETVVRYASPKTSPKILLVKDRGHGGESAYDSVYVKDVLLKRYDVTQIEEPASGLNASMLAGYDVIWFNNPGYPMSDVRSRDALIAFDGGVIVQGDDMSKGLNFDNSSLTGLKFLDNGSSVLCDGKTYLHDDNNGEKYRVSLDPLVIAGTSAANVNFEYGNDIDNTVANRLDLEIIAYAQGGPAVCTTRRPAIVRYIKN